MTLFTSCIQMRKEEIKVINQKIGVVNPNSMHRLVKEKELENKKNKKGDECPSPFLFNNNYSPLIS